MVKLAELGGNVGIKGMVRVRERGKGVRYFRNFLVCSMTFRKGFPLQILNLYLSGASRWICPVGS